MDPITMGNGQACTQVLQHSFYLCRCRAVPRPGPLTSGRFSRAARKESRGAGQSKILGIKTAQYEKHFYRSAKRGSNCVFLPKAQRYICLFPEWNNGTVPHYPGDSSPLGVWNGLRASPSRGTIKRKPQSTVTPMPFMNPLQAPL